MAIHYDTELKPFYSKAVILILLLSVCVLPLVGLRELFGRESEFAAIATEISWRHPFPVAHGELLPYRYPLFPLLAKSLMDIFALTPEWALRLVSFFSLVAIVMMVYDAAARAMEKSDAGAIAAAVVLTNVFMIDRGLWGVPDMLGAAFILAAWLLFFMFGMVQNRWWTAWLSAATFVSLAFLTVGPGGLLIFFVPLLFMTRPISGLARFQRPEAVVSLGLVLAVIAVWEIVRIQDVPEASARETVFGIFTTWRNNNFLWILSSPLDLFLRMLPWSLMLYPVFCPAYKVFERNPVFVRYMKTLFCAATVMILIIPWFRIADDAKVLVPLLGILICIQYPIFIRRNGVLIERFLRPLNVLLLMAGVLLLGYHTLVHQIAPFFNQVKVENVGFAAEGLNFLKTLCGNEGVMPSLYLIGIGIACYVIFLALWLLSPAGRKLPVWVQIAFFTAALGQLHWGTTWHRQIFNNEQQARAGRFRAALLTQTQTSPHELTLYKDPRAPSLYAEGVYLGAKIKKLRHLNELPETDSNIYLISNDVPVPVPNRTWDEKPLLRESYRDQTLFLWLGSPVKPDTAPETREPEKKPVLLLP